MTNHLDPLQISNSPISMGIAGSLKHYDWHSYNFVVTSCSDERLHEALHKESKEIPGSQ
jgi:hypothetical protein